MTYSEFKNKWLGKHCEVAGSANAKNQCVDLVNSYIREVLGLPIVEWTNAVDFPKKCLPPNYEFIKNTITAVPTQGDIMIYESPDGIGHIDIYDNGNNITFVSFSQNWPVGSVCKLVNHTYTGTYKVVGWLRGKPLQVNSDMTESQKRILDFIGERTEGDVREAFGALADMPGKDEQIKKLNEKILTDNEKIKEREEIIEKLNGRIDELGKDNDNWQSDFRTANEQTTKALEEISKLEKEKADYRRIYEAALAKSVDKLNGWELIAEGIKKLFIKIINYVRKISS